MVTGKMRLPYSPTKGYARQGRFSFNPTTSQMRAADDEY